MSRFRVLLGVLALAACGGLLLGDDAPKKTADTKADTPKATKHTLPQGWSQLGLTDEQKKKVYSIEDEYNPKIAALKKQIETLQNEEKAKKYAVLTEEQKKRLRDIREAQDSGAAADKKNDKNKDEKKP